MALPAVVEKYLNDMEIKKKAIGGVDEEDALVHIRQICVLFQQDTEKIKNDLSKAQSEVMRLQEENQQLELALEDTKIELQTAKEKVEEDEKSENADSEADKAIIASKDEEIEALKNDKEALEKKLEDAVKEAEFNRQSMDKAEAMRAEYEKKYNDNAYELNYRYDSGDRTCLLCFIKQRT